MHIYPVLDIQAGCVVHAIRGERDRYRPLRSKIVDSAEPLAVARALRERFGAKDLYVADLDALRGAPPDAGVLTALLFDGFRLLLDAGVRSIDQALALRRLGVENVVVALETLPDPQELRGIVSELGQQHVVFSLDLMDGVPLGTAGGWVNKTPEDIAIDAFEAGARRMIVLDLTSVGSSEGPAQQDLLKILRKRLPNVELISGGGVRSAEDLDIYRALKVDGVLVATALHSGTLEFTAGRDH